MSYQQLFFFAEWPDFKLVSKFRFLDEKSAYKFSFLLLKENGRFLVWHNWLDDLE